LATTPVIPYVFDYATWVAMFPEMSGVSSAAAGGYFAMATLYVRNDGRGPIRDPNMQSTLLNLTTAHLAKLFSTQNAGVPTTGGIEPPNTGSVGRVSQASQGSVSASLEMMPATASSAWWAQSQYGISAWKLLAPFRTMRYVGPTRRRIYNPSARYWGFGI
jgi:hypothetical protein